MTETLIWLIAFAVILVLTVKSWDGALGRFFATRVPRPLQSTRDDRWIWCPAIAVLGATAIVRPVDMLLTLLLLALLIWGIKKLVGVTLNVKH